MFFLAPDSCMLQQCDMYKSERYFLPPKSFHISRLPEGNDYAMKSRSVLINFNARFYKEWTWSKNCSFHLPKHLKRTNILRNLWIPYIIFSIKWNLTKSEHFTALVTWAQKCNSNATRQGGNIYHLTECVTERNGHYSKDVINGMSLTDSVGENILTFDNPNLVLYMALSAIWQQN